MTVSIIELSAFDINTAPQHLITALQPFWAGLYRWGAKSAKIVLCTDYIDAEAAQLGFEQLAVPFKELPVEVAYYRAQYERHLRETVQQNKFIRVYLIIDSNQSAEMMARVITSSGIGVRSIAADDMPLPFRTGERKGRHVIDPTTGIQWVGVQTAVKQDFAQIYPQILHRLYSQNFPLWVVIEIKNYSPTETIQLLKTKQATVTVTQSEKVNPEQRSTLMQADEMQRAIDGLNTEIRAAGNALHEAQITLVFGGDSADQVRERKEIIDGMFPLNLNRHYMQAQRIPRLFSPDRLMVSGFLLTSTGLALLSGSALSWLAPTNTEGVVLGHTNNNAAVIFDSFADYHHSYNIVVLGQTGMGKTFFILLLMLRSLQLGIRLVIVDMKGEVDLSWLGDYYERISMGTEKTPVNLLRILFEQIGGQIAFVQGILNRMGIADGDEFNEQAVLKKALYWMYAPHFGRAIPQFDGKSPPSFPVLQAMVNKVAGSTDLPEAVRRAASAIVFRLDSFVSDADADMFGQVHGGYTLDLNASVTVIDISAFPKREVNPSLRAALLAVTFGMIDMAVEKRREDGHREPIQVFFDEIGDALEDDVTASYVQTRYKLSRSQYVGWIVADQTGTSLARSVYGSEILSNSSSVFLFYQPGIEKETLKKLFPDLPDAYREAIHTFPLGACIAKLPEGTFPMSVVPSQLELVLLSSKLQDREARQLIIEKMKHEAGNA